MHRRTIECLDWSSPCQTVLRVRHSSSVVYLTLMSVSSVVALESLHEGSNGHSIMALESRHEGSNAPSIMSPVVDEERMLGLLL